MLRPAFFPLTLAGTQSGSLTLTLSGGDQPKKIGLHGVMPEGLLQFKNKALDVGLVPCGVPQTLRVQLKNTGTRESAFKVTQRHFLPSAASSLPQRTLSFPRPRLLPTSSLLLAARSS